MKNIIYIILTLSLLIAKQNSFNGNFSIARIQYGGGGDWYANPTSLPNDELKKDCPISKFMNKINIKYIL